MILEQFPSAEEFYKTYWCKKPFIVRQFIAPDFIKSLIDGDALAGLALEEDIKSRIITNNEEGRDWSCAHGPFEEEDFSDLGERNWSLLVQNVEQYHKDTGHLITQFQSSPLWLLDDVMVSYSAPGGSVGPHTDSYHTFLVQGIGKRTWKISSAPVLDDRYVDNPDIKVLKHGFEGEIFDVEIGDVIYMPPFFGHEGKTIEAAMTFSVGFLGPKLSEMLADYAHYLEEHEDLNKRYFGHGLTPESAGANIAPSTQSAVRDDIISVLDAHNFAQWMASYFSTPSHIEIEDEEAAQEALSVDALLEALEAGATLVRPARVKLVITKRPSGEYCVSALGETITVSAAQESLIKTLMTAKNITLADMSDSAHESEAVNFMLELHRTGALILNSKS